MEEQLEGDKLFELAFLLNALLSCFRNTLLYGFSLLRNVRLDKLDTLAMISKLLALQVISFGLFHDNSVDFREPKILVILHTLLSISEFKLVKYLYQAKQFKLSQLFQIVGFILCLFRISREVGEIHKDIYNCGNMLRGYGGSKHLRNISNLIDSESLDHISPH